MELAVIAYIVIAPLVVIALVWWAFQAKEGPK